MSFSRRRVLPLLAAGHVLLGVVPFSPRAATAAEFRVNSYTTQNQAAGVVAMDSEGNFVVVWYSYLQDGSFEGVFGQRFDAFGSPAGPEFQVNSYTNNPQWFPAVAMDSDGDFVVVWQSFGQDGQGDGIFGQRFDSSGAPQGVEFQVNTYYGGGQGDATVAMDSDGDFVVAWESPVQDGASLGIFGQRFDSSGTPRGAEFQVNTYVTSVQKAPAAAIDSAGDFVIVWQSQLQDGSLYGVFGQRFTSSGGQAGGEIQINTFFTSNQEAPAVAMDSDGDFIVIWSSVQEGIGAGGGSAGIFGQRFDSGGAPQGVEFHVNTYTTELQRFPAVAMKSDGSFVVAWQSRTQDGSSEGIFGQCFDAGANPQSGELQINSFTFFAQFSPAVAIDPDGTFVVVWVDDGLDGYGHGIFADRGVCATAATPTPTVTSTPVPATATPTSSSTATPTPTPTSTSTATPTPTSTSTSTSTATQTPTSSSTPTQTPTSTSTSTPTQTPTSTSTPTTPAAITLDIDDSGALGALFDGLLVLRYLFGFSGATLVTNAVDLSECDRCGAGEIETYLASIDDELDIDDDGETEPLTDGMLVLRYLSGFSGDALVAGAIDVDCTRCDAGAVTTYLDGLAN